MCGRHITESHALLRAEHDGRTYLFCSERCRMLFALRPDSFVVDEAQPAADEAQGWPDPIRRPTSHDRERAISRESAHGARWMLERDTPQWGYIVFRVSSGARSAPTWGSCPARTHPANAAARGRSPRPATLTPGASWSKPPGTSGGRSHVPAVNSRGATRASRPWCACAPRRRAGWCWSLATMDA